MPTVLTVDGIPMNGDFSSKSAVHVLNWVSRVDVGAGAVFVAVTLGLSFIVQTRSALASESWTSSLAVK